LCQLFVSHKPSGPTGTPVSLVIRAYSDVMASTCGITNVCIIVREWEREQYIILHCNMNQVEKHSKLLISGANTKIFNFNNNFFIVSEQQLADAMSR
jgi:hypothetical protein